MGSRSTTGGIGAVTLLACLVMPALAEGQEITWLNSYTQARSLATAWNRPLLISFSNRSCSACQTMHQTTLRDPIHTGIISREFICLRVEADRDDYLVKNLKIEVFPTLVFASPQGKILDRLEGLDEARQLSRHIDHALAVLRSQEEEARWNSAERATVEPGKPAAQSPYASSYGYGAGGSSTTSGAPSYWYGNQSNSNSSSPRYFTTNYFYPTAPISC
jgi:thioredoxin-related protein